MTRLVLRNRYDSTDKRDITDICSSYFDTSDGVRVAYHSSLVNGTVVPDIHQTLHRNCYVEVVR